MSEIEKIEAELRQLKEKKMEFLLDDKRNIWFKWFKLENHVEMFKLVISNMDIFIENLYEGKYFETFYDLLIEHDDVERIKFMDEFTDLWHNKTRMLYFANKYETLSEFERKIMSDLKLKYSDPKFDESFPLWSTTVFGECEVGPNLFSYLLSAGGLIPSEEQLEKNINLSINDDNVLSLYKPFVQQYGINIDKNIETSRYIHVHKLLGIKPDIRGIDLKTIDFEMFKYIMAECSMSEAYLCRDLGLFKCGRQEIIEYCLKKN